MSSVARRGDDEGNRLKVRVDDDGDVHVGVLNDGIYHSIEFCTQQGGGRSPRVRKVLLALYNAIEDENKEDSHGATY